MSLRIIGGDLKRKKINTLEGSDTRPTSDRVREALFNILSNQVRNKNVLDLFSGTGALGLESLSRGAGACVFIDANKKAIQIIKKNISSCNLDKKTQVITWNILKNLNCLQSMKTPFDLVFLDPPYHLDYIPQTLTNLQAAGCLKNDATIVIEHSVKEPIRQDFSNFKGYDQRKYGKTNVSFYTYRI